MSITRVLWNDAEGHRWELPHPLRVTRATKPAR